MPGSGGSSRHEGCAVEFGRYEGDKEAAAEVEKTDLVFSEKGKESINPAVILSDILLLCSPRPSGLALMSLSHSEPKD